MYLIIYMQTESKEKTQQCWWLEWAKSNRFNIQNTSHNGAYSLKKGHACDFSEKGQERAKYLKNWAKIDKIWRYFEKGQLYDMCVYCKNEAVVMCPT